jgi:hypothetical protein
LGEPASSPEICFLILPGFHFFQPIILIFSALRYGLFAVQKPDCSSQTGNGTFRQKINPFGSKALFSGLKAGILQHALRQKPL